MNLLALCTCSPATAPIANHRLQTEVASPRAAALILPGLNTATTAYTGLTELLGHIGVVSLVEPLTGYREDPLHATDASIDDWIHDASRGIRKLRAEYPGLPIGMIGFSIGGTIGALTHLQSEPADFLILLAPALSLRPTAWLLYPLSLLSGRSVSLPSFAPTEVQAFPRTPLSWYRALFESVHRVHEAPLSKAPSALIVTSRFDGLVSDKGVREWASTHLKDAKIASVELRPEISGTMDHLLPHPRGAGQSAWGLLREHLEQFFALLPEHDSAKRASIKTE